MSKRNQLFERALNFRHRLRERAAMAASRALASRRGGAARKQWGLEQLENRVLMSTDNFTGTYGIVGLSADHGSQFSSNSGQITVESSGAFTGTINTVADSPSSSSAVEPPGSSISGNLTLGANNSFANVVSQGYYSKDGNIAANAVTQSDVHEETSLNIFIKQGSGLSNATFNGKYNAVGLGVDSSGGSQAFTAGVMTLDANGIGNAAGHVIQAAQGQTNNDAFLAGEGNSFSYTVASNGQLNFGNTSGATGWVSSDGSVIAIASTVQQDYCELGIGIRETTGHSAADLFGHYYTLRTDRRNLPESSIASAQGYLDFDGAGHFSGQNTSIAFGQSSQNGLGSSIFTGTYTVSSTGKVLCKVDSHTYTAFINADGSFGAWATVPGNTTKLETGIGVMIKDPSSPTVNHAPTLTTVSTLTGGNLNTPLTISYADLAAAANENDVDGDPISFKIAAVTTGTLTKNGTAVTPGTTTIASGESLVWTPASNSAGVLGAFKVKANDGFVDSTTAVAVKVNVARVVVSIVAIDNSASESGDTGVYRLTRAGSTSGSLSLKLARTGTATGISDYALRTGSAAGALVRNNSVTIADGESSVDIYLVPVDDILTDPNEQATLTITDGPTYISDVNAASASVTIIDNDPGINITKKQDASEVNPATTGMGIFTISRTGSTKTAVTVNYSVSGSSTAISGVDYAALSGSVIIPAGKAFVSLNVVPIPDGILEGNETVVVNLEAGDYNFGASTSATMNIADNVPVVSVKATDSKATEGKTSDTGRFTFTRSTSSSVPLDIHYTLGGSAENGVDYATLSGTVTIAANATSVTLDVSALADVVMDPNETVILILTPDVNYSVGSTGSQATVTITDTLAVDFLSLTSFDQVGKHWNYIASTNAVSAIASVSSGGSDVYDLSMAYSKLNSKVTAAQSESFTWGRYAGQVYWDQYAVHMSGIGATLTFADLAVSPSVLTGTNTDTSSFTISISGMGTLNGTAKVMTKLVGQSSVTVPAGTFTAYQITLNLSYNGSGQIYGHSLTAKGTENLTLWAVPNVGVVRLQSVSAVSGTLDGQGDSFASSLDLKLTALP